MTFFKKTAVAVAIFCAMVWCFILPPVTVSANQWDSFSDHQERFWDADSPDPTAMVMDGLVVRPLSLAATLAGGVFYVLTLPFSAIGGNSDEAWKQLVMAPAQTTFDRPLGQFYVDFDDVDQAPAVGAETKVEVAEPAAK